MNANLFDPPIPSLKGQKLVWNTISGCGLALVCIEAVKKLKKPLVIVVQDTQQAHRLERELRLCGINTSISLFPDWETLPYDNFSPHQDIISERLATLSTLPRLTQGIVVVPITTLIQKVVPKYFLTAHSFILKVGDKLHTEAMQQNLTQACYRRVSEVMEHGEFAVRGSILDIYPMGSSLPIRIDLFDDEVDSIRYFDPDTQLSQDKVENIHLLPGREFPMHENAIKEFRNRWREKFPGNPKECSVYQDISNHVVPAGIEYYLPLFFEELQEFTQYIPDTSTIVLVGNIYQQAQQFWKTIENRFEQYGHDRLKPLLPPNELFLPVEMLFARLKEFPQIVVNETSVPEDKKNAYHFSLEDFPNIHLNHKLDNPLQNFQTFLEENPECKVLLCAETKGRRETLKELLAKQNLFPTEVNSISHFLQGADSFCITIAAFDLGLFSKSEKLIIIAEAQLYGTQVMQRRRRRKSLLAEADHQIRNLAELQMHDPIVHVDFGVGRYRGLIRLNVGNYEAEFLQIEYAANDKLYVPVSSLHLVSKFTGIDPEYAPLNKLGTDQWDKAKQKALKKVADVAAELLDIYAQRKARKGFSYSAPDENYAAFASLFPFEETEDQTKAIQAVVKDMQSEKPMDRLVCGDVGFGKTEVAMRAAFLAVQNSKQVAVLVPTTLLAQQHYETFKDRFAEWPVRIDVFSRFRSKKEQADILTALQEGKIDIIIGTHKLIQPDVQFKDLGLVIIDEEHRFGVKQKEKLKSLRSEVDILTLTATPIPRTLNMAFAQIRDLSIIATPPQKRLSIKTFVRDYQKPLIREAILRELMRGGQVYYLHNNVETINKIVQELSELVPEARINMAHGQMRERELERVMADFYHQRSNVLVCTTIIETGIDVPSANTILIERADKLGLAQLHQLRGRVGRSHHQAYAYCLTPPKKMLKADAVKRLEALESLEELGSGFTLATHDLEIRGAGELLGEEQSGEMQSIGFHLYMEILDRAVKALQKGESAILDMPISHGCEIDLHISAMIPEDYIADVHTRLILYKRISHAANSQVLEDLQSEMIDRFGLFPSSVSHLFAITQLKLKAQPLGIKKIEANPSGGRIQFDMRPNINTLKIIELIRTQPQMYEIKGSEVLKFKRVMLEAEERFTIVNQLLTMLQPPLS